MLLQRLPTSSIEDGFCYASDILRLKGCVFDLMPCAETWQKNSKSEMDKNVGHASNDGTTSSNLPKEDIECSLSHIQSCNTSDCSAINFVYKRRRHLKNPTPVLPAYVSVKASPKTITFVYERRKHQKSSVTNFLSMVSANTTPPNGICSSSIRSENPTTTSLEKTRDDEADAARVSSLSARVGDKELRCDNGYSGTKDKKNKSVALYSVNDSCSSSLLNVDGGIVPPNTEVDDNDECSSSGAHVTDVSAKALCASILQNHSLLNRSGSSDEKVPSCSNSGFSRTCHVCEETEEAVEMLICDDCEEAFHLSCFNPSIKKIPIDDWYCQSCAKKKNTLVKERAVARSSIIGRGKGTVASEGRVSPIELMLKDTRPYVSSVRVGKGFQAVVPEWRGPATKGLDVIPVAMELDPSIGVNFSTLNPGKTRKFSFLGNWLQCRDVITGMGDDIDGTICGKWRRAPLSEVQTDKWDCFRSVIWDPAYADCSVPQELETEEVLKQLKYMEILKPRLLAKRRKLDICSITAANRSQVAIEDASVETV